MASVNKVILVGHLGRDPEVRTMRDGTAIANTSLATAYQWTDKQSGEKKEETEWHRVVFRGRLAEVAGEYLKKGAQIYLEGRLRTRKWPDEDGAWHYTTEVFASSMQMLGQGERADTAREPLSRSKAPTAPARRKPAIRSQEELDEIPF